MNYRSISDMNSTILKNIDRIPRDLDLVVGIPRSGLLAANLLALLCNIRLTDLDSYLDGRTYTSGTTKAASMRQPGPGPRKVLILDDSINFGEAITAARRRVAEANIGDEVNFAAVYGNTASCAEADIVFEVVPQPRLFQWNFMHHVALERACVDIDGVLCHDPTEDENDDGSAYLRFLAEARPLYSPSRTIGTLVTSRLEKYRPQTEAWLEARGLTYRELVMLDLPSKVERQRMGAHGTFKADYYRKSHSDIFIESENGQAMTIARLSGKPVLCLQTHTLINPSLGAVLSSLTKAGSHAQGLTAVKRAARTVLGSTRYEALKTWRAGN
jgi:uncharacterized HAD superfamily protein/hypoxanthine phosphoribosyltransferase